MEVIILFEEKIDIKENNIFQFDYDLLSILLKDNTTGKNILWGTDNYINRGNYYKPNDEIKIEQIISYNGSVIKPRIKKSKMEQEKRSKDKGEVFTPAWVCNIQNNIVDTCWFGYENVFNKELTDSWKTNKKKIEFPENKTWKDYVNDIRLEITCGEAPYLISRYDTTSGDIIPVIDRIGILDRKLRVINENVNNENEWIEYSIMAFKSTYGYEWQGDSLLIARENMLYTFCDNYYYKFNCYPSKDLLKEIASIISWNLFQMDGLKYVIPYSCKNEERINYTLFGEEIEKFECDGCKKDNCHLHNGIYAKIMNWQTNRKVKFISILKNRNN